MMRVPARQRAWLAPALALLCAATVHAAPMLSDQTSSQASSPPGLAPPSSGSALSEPARAQAKKEMLDSLGNGRWTRACQLATSLVASKVPDLDALGVFGVCSASANDRAAADSALRRLRDVDSPPYYYSPLVAGVLQLRDKSAEKAEQSFKAALQARPNDPLALYFSGEAQHARNRDTDALATFNSVLKIWPRFAPAMTAAARLMARPDASRQELTAARELVERATGIEPMNRGYWRLLVEFCERTGQTQRASAIRLQWLTLPSPPK